MFTNFWQSIVTRFFLLPLPQSLKKRVYNNLHLKYFKVLGSDFPITIYKWPIDICTGVTQVVAGIWLSMESALYLVSDVTN